MRFHSPWLSLLLLLACSPGNPSEDRQPDAQKPGVTPDAGGNGDGQPDSGTEPDAGDPEPPDAAKPSIIYIVADDLDRRTADEHLPKIKNLITDKGIRFRNYFTTFSLCGPARASVLTGKYPHNHRMLDNYHPIGRYVQFYEDGNENQTVAVWLQKAGYRTALIGKYLNGYPTVSDPLHVPKGWSDWHAFSGAVNFYDYVLNENGQNVNYGAAPGDYSTDVIARKTVALIKSTPADQPLFAYVAPYAPHGPATPAPRHRNMFAGLTYPHSPSFNEADVSDKPAWLSQYPLLTQAQVEGVDGKYQSRVESIQAVDDLVEKIVQALQSTGRLKNTFIVFTSDNGFHLGEHRIAGGKRSAYEEDIPLPLYVRGPGVPAGQTRDHWVLNIDLADTFAQLGKVTPTQTDGMSFAQVMTDDPPPLSSGRKDFYIIQRYSVVDMGLPDLDAVRSGKWKYIESDVNGHELYDLSTDPHELNNLYPSADTELLNRLRNRMQALKACAGATCW